MLLAPPGAGKGTQARRLAARYGITQISSGELFRENVRSGTLLGRIAAAYLLRGDLVPDELALEMMATPITEAASRGGFVLDGFPRTVRQAEELEQLCDDAPAVHLNAVIDLAVSRDELRSRLLARARSEGRSDDTAQTIDRRLTVFEEETRLLVAFYSQRGLLLQIDGQRSMDEVFSDIVAAISKSSDMKHHRPSN